MSTYKNLVGKYIEVNGGSGKVLGVVGYGNFSEAPLEYKDNVMIEWSGGRGGVQMINLDNYIDWKVLDYSDIGMGRSRARRSRARRSRAHGHRGKKKHKK